MMGSAMIASRVAMEGISAAPGEAVLLAESRED
jgi:hypothetical protein